MTSTLQYDNSNVYYPTQVIFEEDLPREERLSVRLPVAPGPSEEDLQHENQPAELVNRPLRTRNRVMSSIRARWRRFKNRLVNYHRSARPEDQLLQRQVTLQTTDADGHTYSQLVDTETGGTYTVPPATAAAIRQRQRAQQRDWAITSGAVLTAIGIFAAGLLILLILI